MAVIEEKLEDRRIFDRFHAKYPARFKDSRDRYGQRVALYDASAMGVQVLTDQRLYLNDHIALEVKLPYQEEPLILRGKIAWVKNESNGDYSVGIKLHNIQLIHLSRLYQHSLYN